MAGGALLFVEIDHDPARHFSPLQLLHALWEPTQPADFAHRLQFASPRILERLRSVLHVTYDATRDGELQGSVDKRVGADNNVLCRWREANTHNNTANSTPNVGDGVYKLSVEEATVERSQWGRTFVTLPRRHHNAMRSDTIGDFDHFGGDILLRLEVDKGHSAASFRQSCFLFSGIDDDRSHSHGPVIAGQQHVITQGEESGTYLANCTPWIPTPPPPPGNTTHRPACNRASFNARCIVEAAHMIGPATSSGTPSGMRVV